MILLDTHAWLWLTSAPERLSEAARGAIEASGDVRVSAVSCWEVGVLAKVGRIALDRPADDWVRHALMATGADAVDVDMGVAARAASIYERGVASDPADLMIAATAIEYRMPLVSRDRRLAALPGVQVVW